MIRLKCKWSWVCIIEIVFTRKPGIVMGPNIKINIFISVGTLVRVMSKLYF